MQRRQQLLLSFMVWGLVLFYGTTVATALTPQEIAKIAEDSTVLLEIGDAKGNLLGTGSGFIVHDGQIVTNYHVIKDMSIGFAKLVGKENKYRVKVLVVDKERDLAIVKAAGIDAPALPLGDSDAVQIADKVYVMGNPQRLEGTFSSGEISAIRLPGDYLTTFRLSGGDTWDWHAPCKLLQMTAPISKGSSGGPVLNNNGEVVGIASAGLSFLQPDLTDFAIPENLNFAVAVNHLKLLIAMPIMPTLAEPQQVKPQADPPPTEPKPVLTAREIAQIALGSTVHLGLIDTKGNSWTGSGFVIHDGHIATNHHVIDNMSIGGARLVGKEDLYRIEAILAADKVRDLAIIKIVEIDVPTLPLGDSDTVQIGDKVYVVGNPQGLEGSFSDGIISAIRGDSVDKFFQMTAPISHGSSGGPVFNEKGEVIGVSFATFHDGQNLNFAIPVNYLKALANIPIAPPPALPKQVEPEVDPPKPEPPELHTRHDTLEKGIKLYEQAKYNEAIKVLSSAIPKLEDPEQRARAYLYLGCSKRGSGEGNDKVREHFEASIRHNPNQKLPPRLGKDHPIFAELLEVIRKELTGELTVISLLPQTEIWIEGNKIDRKMLGTGIVSSRLLAGNYIVEGIYTGKSQRETITIEPDRHEVLDLKIPPIVEHDSPSRISAGERIPLTLNLITSKGPQQVKIYYKIYDRNRNELEQNNQEMRLWDQQSASSTWAYKVDLPSQKHVGLIEYYIEVEYDNHVVFRQPRIQNRYYQISIVDDKPPTISLLDPPEGAQFTVNQQTTVRAEVIDNSVVEEVRIYFLAPNDQGKKLFEERSSDMYTIDITFRRAGSIEYYLTATDEVGNESQSESRHIDIRLQADPQELGEESQEIVGLPDKRVAPIEPDTPEKRHKENTPSSTTVAPSSPTSRTYPIYQGIWASVSADDASTFDWDGSYMFRLAYLREGKNQSTLGAQLDFSHPDRTNMSAMVQWGLPALGKSNIAFTLLGGIAEYEDSPRSTHMTPILGAGLKFYPRDKIAIDATSSIKVRSDYDTTDFYHYEVGIRFYITRELSLRVGYGQLYLGDRNVPTIQVGLGYTF